MQTIYPGIILATVIMTGISIGISYTLSSEKSTFYDQQITLCGSGLFPGTSVKISFAYRDNKGKLKEDPTMCVYQSEKLIKEIPEKEYYHMFDKIWKLNDGFYLQHVNQGMHYEAWIYTFRLYRA